MPSGSRCPFLPTVPIGRGVALLTRSFGVRIPGRQPVSMRPSSGLPAGLQNLSASDRHVPGAPLRRDGRAVNTRVCKTRLAGSTPARDSSLMAVRPSKRREPAVNRLLIGALPMHRPSPASTMAVQEFCKLLIGVRSLGWAPIWPTRSPHQCPRRPIGRSRLP